MAEEQTTEVIVTAIAEQITISDPIEKFAQEKAVIAKLAEIYPNTFFVDPKQRKPLKVGIFNEIVENMPPELSKKQLRNAMNFYCNDFEYLRAVKRDTHRIDLNGHPVEEIIAQHKEGTKKIKKSLKTPENTPSSESNMAERETLTLKRKPAAAITENKSSPVKPNQADGDTVNASAKSAKITLVLDVASITRINSEGKKQVKFVVQVGEMKFTAELNSKSYRKALATMDELGADNCNAILQGSMPQFGMLDGVGLVVQLKKAKEEPIAEV